MSRRYRERHTKMELIPCLAIMIIIAVAGVVIIDAGFSGNGGNGTTEVRYKLRIELYSSVYENLTGIVTTKVGDNLYENITTDGVSPIFTDQEYKGTYLLYYKGIENRVEYGPVEFTVEISGLVTDQMFFGIRVTVHALG